MSFKPDDISQIRKYLNGELDARAMHRLEKRAQEDPFFMDALEGYSNRKDQQNNLEDMQRKLQKRMRKSAKKPVALWPLIAVAIAVLALILLGAWWVMFNEPSAKRNHGKSSILMKANLDAVNFYIIANRLASGKNETHTLRRHLVLVYSNIYNIEADTIKNKSNRDGNVVQTSEIPITAASGFKRVTGRVRTVIGERPIPQAIVWNQTTDRQYATDIKGFYTVDARIGDTLYFGYRGFKNEKVVVGKGNKINIDMEQKNASLFDSFVKGLNINTYDDLAHPEIGWDKFRSLQSRVKSPDGKKGTVKVKFTVNPDNSLSDFIIIDSLSTATHTEAIHFIKEQNKWLHNTNNKPQTLTLKIKFRN